MKIYSNNIHTDMDKLKSICKKYVIHPFFLTEDGFYRTNQQQYYKGEFTQRCLAAPGSSLGSS